MSKIRFLYDNPVAAAGVVVTASSQVSSLPASNAVIPDRSLVWRSATASTDQWIAFDLLSAQTVTGIALANPKIHQGGTFKAQYSSDGSSWTDAGTFTAADTDSKVSVLFISSISRRYWRMFFTNVGAVGDYVEIGYAFVGQYLEPLTNVVVPVTNAIATQSTVLESPGGQRSATRRPQRSQGRWSWSDIVDADLASLQTMFRVCDVGVPFFVVLDTTRAWTAWLGFFESEVNRQFNVMTGRYDSGFDWKEAA